MHGMALDILPGTGRQALLRLNGLSPLSPSRSTPTLIQACRK
jgi:hypothetical protein